MTQLHEGEFVMIVQTSMVALYMGKCTVSQQCSSVELCGGQDLTTHVLVTRVMSKVCLTMFHVADVSTMLH